MEIDPDWNGIEHPMSAPDAQASEGAVGEVAAWRDVQAERERQISACGWTPEHDDEHKDDTALSRAAACYALAGLGASGPFWVTHLQTPQQIWPYRWEWKPKTRRQNLVRAAALLLAEIERIDRARLSDAAVAAVEGENGRG